MILKTHSQKGFSLLELLLSIGVVVTLLTIVSVIFNNGLKASIDRKVAREMQQLQNAAFNYTQLNLDTLITNNIPAVGNVFEIPIANIIAQGFLPVGYGARNSYRQNLRVFIRKLANNTVNGEAVEVITLSDGNRIEDKRLFNAASNAEPSIGIISNLNISGTCCNGNIQSISGSWSIPLTAAYFGGAIFPLLPTPNANGGYMAAYDIVSSTDVLTNNYLFRNNVAASPELNKMETDLILNNSDIINAGYIVSDSSIIGGNATFLGLEPDGATRSPYVLAVRDNFSTTQNLSVTDNGDPLRGNITIEGDENTGIDFNVTGTMTLNNNITGLAGNISANSVSTDNISLVNFAEFNTLNNSGASLIAGNIFVTTGNVDFSGNVATNNLQVVNSGTINNIISDNALVGTTTITNPTGLSIPATIDVGNNVAVSSNITTNNVDVTNTATITNMTNCTSGCP